MTRTKVTKTIAIVLAMCLAFALMSVTMLNRASAAEPLKITGKDYTLEISEPVIVANPNTANWYVASTSSYENAPEFVVDVTFNDKNGKMADKELADIVEVYSDSSLDTKVELPENFFDGSVKTAESIAFTMDLSKVTTLKNGTYYLSLAKDLTTTEANEGVGYVIQFTIPGTKNSSTSTTTRKTTTTTRTTTTRRTYTTRTTYRTVRTVSSTVRANSANTGDESNMPLWIAVAILAAGAGSIAFVWKAKE